MSSIFATKFGTFEPPGPPFSASDEQKSAAPIFNVLGEGSTVYLGDFQDAHEVVKVRIDLYTDANPPTAAVITWFNDDTGSLLYQHRISRNSQTGFLEPSANSWMESWIGIKQGELDRAGNYAVAFATEGESEYTRQTFVLHFKVEGSGPGTPPPPGEVVQKHEIRIRYREGIFGVADRLAQKSPGLISKIAGLLPSEFVVKEVYADTLNNEIIIRIDERGYNVIQVAVIVAIVAVVVAIIAVFYLGYTYSENAILKATAEAQQAARTEMEAIILDPTLTDEQKIAKILEILLKTPGVVVPPPKDPLGDIAGIVKWGVIGLIAVSALNALPRRK